MGTLLPGRSEKEYESARQEVESERIHRPHIQLYTSYYLLSGDVPLVEEVEKREWSRSHKVVLGILDKLATQSGIFAYKDCTMEESLCFAFSKCGNYAYECVDEIIAFGQQFGMEVHLIESANEIIVSFFPDLVVRFYKHTYPTIGQTLASMDDQKNWEGVLQDGTVLRIGDQTGKSLWRGGKAPSKIMYNHNPETNILKNAKIIRGMESDVKEAVAKYHTPGCIPPLNPYTLRGPDIPVEYRKLWTLIHGWGQRSVLSSLPREVLEYLCVMSIRSWVRQAILQQDISNM